MAKADEEKKLSAPEEEIKETEATEKTDDALENYLNRSQESDNKDKKAPAKRKLSKGAIGLIIAIVAVAALIIIVVAVINQPVKPIDEEELPVKPVEMATTVDEKGEHHVEIATDAEGEIKQNGYGELISYIPAQISKIEVENSAGSFIVNAETPEGEHTVYTITGFEGYDLREDMADSVANDASTLTLTTVAAVNANLNDFGLEQPRATVKVSYTDDTSAIFKVGNEADGGAGTYVTMGGSSDVFLVENEAVDSFLFNVLDLISYEITTKADNVENDAFSVIEVSGSRYPEAITMVPNTDEAVKAQYRLTAPKNMFADDYEGNDIAGSIRDLYAESVVCVNPSEKQLGDYGVKTPYAKVHAVYPDTEIELCCSAPDDNGMVNLYHPEKGIIYTINHSKLGWAGTNMEQLLPKNIIELNKDMISHIDVTSKGKDYSVDVAHTTETVIDESGEKQQVPAIEASLNNKKISEESTLIFFQNFNAMSNLGMVDQSGTNVVYRWTVSYTNGRDDDTIAFYENGGKSCPVVMNGEIIGSVSKSHVAALQQDILDIAAGKTPKSL